MKTVYSVETADFKLSLNEDTTKHMYIIQVQEPGYPPVKLERCLGFVTASNMFALKLRDLNAIFKGII